MWSNEWHTKDLELFTSEKRLYTSVCKSTRLHPIRSTKSPTKLLLYASTKNQPFQHQVIPGQWRDSGFCNNLCFASSWHAAFPWHVPLTIPGVSFAAPQSTCSSPSSEGQISRDCLPQNTSVIAILDPGEPHVSDLFWEVHTVIAFSRKNWSSISNPTMRTGLDFKPAQFDQVWGEAEDRPWDTRNRKCKKTCSSFQGAYSWVGTL